MRSIPLTHRPAAATATPDGALAQPRSRVPRLVGVDLLRGLAAFGVVFIHAGLVVRDPSTPGVERLRGIFSLFAVPFFLAASLYFAVQSELRRRAPADRAVANPWLRKRLPRVLLPYAVWTLVYVAAHCADALVLKGGQSWREIFKDPVGLLFFGGGGVALYFLPLLVVGFLTVRLLGPVLRSVRLSAALALLLGTLYAARLLDNSGNAFSLITERAFEPLLGSLLGADKAAAWAGIWPVRIALVALSDLIRCLPYVLLALLWIRGVASAAATARWRWTAAAVAGAVCLLGLSGRADVPESLLGFAVLSLGVLASLGGPKALAAPAGHIGAWSFGIYLIHQLVLEAAKIGLRGRISAPAGLGCMLALSGAVWVVAALILSGLPRNALPTVGRAFGLPDP